MHLLVQGLRRENSRLRADFMDYAAMAGIARARLAEERKSWRKDHPLGFFARLESNSDGSQNLMKWKCGIPGKEGTLWAGGLFEISMEFTEDYPHKPPKCRFPQNFFHPNVILNEEEAWKPGITIKQILLGIQDLLDNPNQLSPAQQDAYHIFTTSKTEYERRVRKQVAENRPDRFQ